MKRIVALLSFGVVAAAANATPTGLYLMPIADILAHREGFAFIGAQGTERNIDKGYAKFNALTVGLFDRVEVGVDNDFLGTTTFNVKVQVWDSPKQLPNSALSVGFTNCNGRRSDPYIVGRYDFKEFRIHAGVWRTMDTVRAMFGTDFSLLGGTASVEFLSGPGSQTWFGYYFDIKQVEGLGIMLSVGVPSDHSAGIQHAAVLNYGFKF